MHLDVAFLPEQAVEVDPAELLVGRRAAPRLPVQFLARLQIGQGLHEVIVSDISATGARLESKSPLPVGTRGRLAWEDLECECRIVWSGRNLCGVAFDDLRGTCGIAAGAVIAEA